jgi:anaerobic magnesium-protoporphyrin IX monomethyl ester cyclase
MKKMNIVLLEYFVYKRFEKYSLGLSYLHSYLLINGYNSNLLMFENETLEKTCDAILAYEPDVVGIKVFIENTAQVFAIVRKLKSLRSGIRVVLGGHIATLYSAQILEAEPDVDFIVFGEGEESILELCARLKEGKNLKGCPGVFYRDAAVVFKGEPRNLIADLDSLPFPSLQLIERQSRSLSPYLLAAIATSRGCIGQCNYCVVKKVFHRPTLAQWRGRSGAKVAEEIENIQRHFPGKNLVIRFVDSAFEDPDPVKKGRIYELLDFIAAKQLQISFTFSTRTESWGEADAPLLQRLKETGLYSVSLGFNESIHKKSGYRFTKDAISSRNIQTYRLFKENRIPAFSYLILFHPFVALEELYECVAAIRETGMAYHPDAWLHSLTLFPDTELFHDVVACGLLLAKDQDNYSYLYGYLDGRVERVHLLIKQLQDQTIISDLRSSIAKINLELELYDVWKRRESGLTAAAAEVEAYRCQVRAIYDELGSKQVEYFTRLLDQTDRRSNEITLEAWAKTARELQARLEQAWVLCKLKTGRKKVYLL